MKAARTAKLEPESLRQYLSGLRHKTCSGRDSCLGFRLSGIILMPLDDCSPLVTRTEVPATATWWAREGSNFHLEFRKLLLYPVSLRARNMVRSA